MVKTAPSAAPPAVLTSDRLGATTSTTALSVEVMSAKPSGEPASPGVAATVPTFVTSAETVAVEVNNCALPGAREAMVPTAPS